MSILHSSIFIIIIIAFIQLPAVLLVVSSSSSSSQSQLLQQQHRNISIDIINNRWSNNNHQAFYIDYHHNDAHNNRTSLLSSLTAINKQKLSSSIDDDHHHHQASSSISMPTTHNQQQLKNHFADVTNQFNIQNISNNLNNNNQNNNLNNNFICRSQFGHYRDPNNCAAYYICSFGIALHKNCSEGLYFSLRLQTCDWPSNVPCEQDYASLNAGTSMYSLVDETKSTTTTSTPSPLSSLNNYYSTASTSNNPTITLPHRNISELFKNLLDNKSFLFQLDTNATTKTSVASSTINQHYPTSSSKSSLKPINNVTNSHQLNTLEKHHPNGHHYHNNNHLSSTPVVDGFEISPNISLKSNVLMNKYIPNTGYVDDTKFKEINIQNFSIKNNQSNNQQFQKRQGPFEPYWPQENGYYTIQDNGKHMNPFTIYNHQPSLTATTSSKNFDHIDLHLISTNPYINDKTNNKNNQAIQTYFWLDNLPSLQSRSIDSDRSKRPYREQAYSNQYNQNIFRPYDLDGNKSLKKDHGTEPKLMAITTSTTSAKPWIERSVRRKIPEFYVKFVTADNISTPYMVVNDHSNQEMIQPSSKPTTTVPLSHTKLPRQNEVKKLNYEINERLLAPFTKQYQIKPDDSMAFKYKNNVGRDDKISNNYSSGFNRYSDDHHKSTTAAAFVHHHPQSTTIGQMIRPITTSRASTSRFRKKIIRKKKTNNQQISTIPSQPLSSAMAASSSSSKSNIYGHHHHPSTNLLTGTLVTTSYNAANNRNHDNNDNNKEQKLLRRNSRPPLYKTTTLPLNFVQDASPSSWTPSATPFRNLSPTTTTTTTTPVPMIPLQSSNVPLAAEHFTTPKPSQRNRPQQINEHKNDLISSNKHNQNIDNVNQHLLMRSVDGDKSESLMLVPMLIDHDHKHGSHLNLAQYNSYVVMPTNNDQNHMINRNNQVKSSQLSTSMATNINKSDANNNKQYESLKNPIETLEEFIKKTIDKITSTTTTTTTRAPTINSATSSSATSITSTTTTTTTALPPTTSSPVPLTTVSHILKGSSTKEQVFKKIKAINGYRRNRKYRRPLISLNQQQQQHPTTKTLNITTTTYSQQHFNNNNSDNHGKHNDIDDVSLINHTNNNNSKLLFNLSDPSTISFYETIKNNHLDSTTNNHDNNQWSLTTTTTPSSPTTVVQSYHLLSPPKSPYKTIAFSPSPPTSTTSYAEVPKIVTPFTSGPIRPSHWNKFKNSRKIRLPSSPKTTSTTTTTTTTIIPTNVDVNNGNNFTDYNYYDYDNFNGDDSNGSDDHDNIHDDYHNNMLNEGGRLLPSTTSTTTTTTTTTTTSTTTSTIAPPLSSLSLSSNSNNNTRMTRNGKKPLIYLKNRPRPTIRRLVIKDPDDELNGKVIQASRPKPLFQQPKALITASKCDKRKCRLPDCRCGSSDIPGGLSSKQIPQLVMLTFDDAVNDLNWELYEELLNSGRKNPNGCPVKATFYVSHEWTDYGQVQTLYSRGHEIASHTISHRFGEKFSKDEWIKEINGQREILNLYGGVKFDDIRGMRAPFLQTGGNNMFEMLYETNFTYDSSLPVQENSPAFWPYTLDYSLSHSCNIPPCPTKSFPGVWEVGMVMWSDLRGGRCSMGDACTNPSDEDGVYEMLIKNFNRHYKNNRAPFSLYYHSAWFNVQHHRKGFIRFLDDILQNDDVYMTTTWQMLQWVREPVTLSDLDSFEPFKCSADKVINECTRPKICNVHSKQGSRTLRTCQECPTVFPWIGNTGFPKSKYG